jgi:outer membrane receptor protein involved in Fe transport
LRYFRHPVAVLALAATSFAPFALAQTSKGTLAGVVRDLSGAVVSNATIIVTNEDTGENRTVHSGDTGTFRVEAINPGRYTLHVESPGFSQFEIKDLAVKPTQITDYDPKLSPGQVSETVQVNGAQVLLDTENASLGNDIGGTDLAKLPIFSLNPIELALNVPGVQIVSNSGFSNGEAIQVSGARPRANNFLVDGQEINDASIAGQAVQPDIPDMYSNVIVYTHNPPAEFGRASGGVVNLITRSGTNAFHGGLWELYTGSGLNARDGQLRQTTTPISRYDQHQYGFTIGGPIIHDKLFAFGAGQWTRYYGQEEASVVNLPDASGYAVLQQLANSGNTNAQTLLPYLDNGSYLNNFSNLGNFTAVSVGAACPAAQPNCTVSIGRFLRPSEAEQSPDTQWTYKVDFIPRQSDTFSFRYLHDRASLTPDFFNNGTALPGFDTNQGGPSELGQGTWTHVFSSTLLNELRASEARLSFLFGATASAMQNPLFTGPNLSFSSKTGISELGFDQNFPQGRSQDLYQIQDTLSWTVGRNTIRVGADIGRRIEKDLVSQNLNGGFTFADGGTGVSSLGNYLLNQLGPSGAATITIGSTRLDPHSWRSGVFGQDDVKVTPNLTLNLGFRYDYFTNPENVLKYPAIDPNNPYAPINAVYKVAADTNNIAPRVGFSYAPHAGLFADGKTVFRGGFGVFFDSDFTNIADNSQQSAPNSLAVTQTQTTGNGLTNALSQLTGLSGTLNPQSSVESVVKNLVSPYTYEYNLGFERALPGAIQLSVNYVGSEGKSLYANQQYNYFSAETGLRLNPDRGAIIARGNFAASDYNGLEVGVGHQFSHGLEIHASYDYSKSLDDGSEVFTTSSSPTSYSANLAPGGRSQDWGPSAYDHRHYASITYVYSPPGAHSDNHLLDGVLGAATRGWTFSGEEQFQAGAYSTVNFSGIDANGDGSTANDRPLLSNSHAPFSAVGIDGAYLGATPGVYYDLSANNQTNALNVVKPGDEHWLIYNGSQYLHQAIGRNSFENPGLMINNLAAEKAFRTPFFHGEKSSLILRAEAQNIGNHDNIGLLDVNLLDVGTAAFQNNSNARNTDARNLRLWAKFSF